MGRFLRLSNGVARSFDESSSLAIYDVDIEIVASSPTGNQLVGPIIAGTSITLPASQTYTSNELEVYLNGQRAEVVLDYNFVGSPLRTQISFTFNLVVGDHLRLRIDRAP